MHYSKTYDQLLLTLPPELRDNAIEYRKLKKLIHEIVSELESIGLTPQVLQQLLQQQINSDVKGKAREASTSLETSHPLFPKVVYEFTDGSDQIEPRLHFWIRPNAVQRRAVPPDPGSPQAAEVDGEEEDLAPASGILQSTGEKPQDNLLYMIQKVPSSNNRAGDVDEYADPLDLTEALQLEPYDSTISPICIESGDREIIVPLVHDTAFYRLLSTALQSIAEHLSVVEAEFTRTLQVLSVGISQSARPVSSTSAAFHPHSQAADAGAIRAPIFRSTYTSKSDLYAWRQIFQLYVETEVFDSLSERQRGERTIEDSESRLKAFAERVTGRGLGDGRTLKLKESRAALETFLRLNVLLLDLKKFQRANIEATRKILKKHAKRTALPLPSLTVSPDPAPSHSSSALALQARHPSLPNPIDPMTLIIPSNIASLPRTLVQAMSETLLPIIPHVDDYACLICTSIAFKPIRLFCGHLFCVRCLVKMQKRGKGNCPMCRAPTVLQADRSNVDWALLNFMQDWFPEESREKLRHNEREAAEEQLEELGLNAQGCLLDCRIPGVHKTDNVKPTSVRDQPRHGWIRGFRNGIACGCTADCDFVPPADHNSTMDPTQSSLPPDRDDEDTSHRPVIFTLPSYASAASSVRGVSSRGLSTPATPVTPRHEERTHLLEGDDGRDMERGLGNRYGGTATPRSVRGASRSSTRFQDRPLIFRAEPPKSPGKATSKWAKVRYYIPSLYWIPNYSMSLLGGDMLAGVTVAAMLIPQSVSYASSLAKLSPVTGLFSASIPGIVYALLGTSRQLNVAPEAALSLLVGQAVSDALHSDPHSHPTNPDAVGLAVASAITIQVGLISFILGFFRLGFLDVVLSRALLRGFISAVAVVILIEQLIPMFGLTALEHQVNPRTTLDKAVFLFEYGFTHFHKPTTVVSFGALFALVFLRNVKRMFVRYPWIYRIPEVLVVVIISTILSDKFDWDQDGIEILGSVPINTGKHFLVFPLHHSHLKYLRATTSTAVLIVVIGFLDSIVAAKQNAARFGYSVSPNRELVALGAANLSASFIPGTLPAYGSITRSRINADVGGRTQMASFICSAIVLLATFFLLPWLYYLPKCVLGSIICLIVFSLIAETPHDVRYYWTMRSWMDVALMCLTFALSIIWNVQVGVVVSLIISLLLVVRRSSRPRMTILGRIPGTDRWKPINENPEAEEDVPGALIVRIRENLDFGANPVFRVEIACLPCILFIQTANTAQLKERLRRLELYGIDPSHPSEEPRRQLAKVIVFHVADVESCDASAVQIFYELFESYTTRGVNIFITHLRSGPREMFERGGIVKLLGENAFYEDVATAINRIASDATFMRYSGPTAADVVS
ncbi:hypothetical protein EW146_g8389 [Bondarzewia mesenterica]|uniref:RING-type domain-containing protein n=1 Tax=Bondarzewia mesenterica TaxID=1095465 RepID=A0A4S4LER0_9AGAM|nr:hypothetical protein EW146_g8389 [Bondarzewia mesenterica]